MTTKPPLSPTARMAIDYGPLVVFFAANSLLPGSQLERVLAATAVFMVAIIAAMVYSQLKAGTISPMLWLSGALVLVFGSLTLYFHDQAFIQMKPTIVYGMFAAILAFGLITGRPLLQSLLETAYPGLTPKGWRLLTINWMIFFVAQAGLNEVMRAWLDWDGWVAYKTWAVIPMTLVFAIANIPMLMRHGLKVSDPKEAPIPPEG
ncbi:inner membrane-spanning protein YciB [Sphingomonas qomolangmaensis]|uniref:Inner membrane-spanning protein YciB n=1 Tax=Sphingomonas qomolangmaensis TaxID=2918765 RepID=A0ABY5L9L0_9SPHN|nr:inner membrane-spanning protein YciB [Sphingomonas qomolangmaensis]UUL83638.1 septation protein IspZ [Sphingomonas qomolangmaensis]